jgi:putative phosphoribosyl transferase
MENRIMERTVHIPTAAVALEGNLTVPDGAVGIVIFAHGSGSGRHSPRNRFVAKVFNASGMATLLLDLLTHEEEKIDALTRELRFDISLLSNRVVGAIDWMKTEEETKDLHIGVIGSSTGAASALVAASARPKDVYAVVSRGGRPDLAGNALPNVKAPTLMIVGGEDIQVIALNKEAKAEMSADVSLRIIPGATHLFEEPGTLEYAAELSRDWFMRYL